MEDAVLVAVGLIIGLATHLVMFYYREKGKNAATKEDVREIMRESERGKNDAIQESIQNITRIVESIKADTEVNTQKRILHASEERSALNGFIDLFDTWFNGCRDINFGSMYEIDSDEADLLLKRRIEEHAKVTAALQKVHRFIDNRLLADSIDQAFEATESIMRIGNEILIYDATFQRIKKDQDQSEEFYDELKSMRQFYWDTFGKDHLAASQKAMAIVKEMRVQVNQHLRTYE